MNLFHNRYKELAAQLSAELNEITAELHIERARRISAEAIAEERRLRADSSDEYARRAEAARDKAINEKMASLDLVNTSLLKARMPEGPPPRDIKEYTVVSKPKPPSPFSRRADAMFAQQAEQTRSKKSPADPAEAAKLQMESLGMDKLLQ